MPTTGHTAQTEQRILNDSKDSLYDTIATTPYLETTVGAVAQRATATDVGGKIAQDVNIVGGSLTGSDGAILDGTNSAIKATVLDYTSSNPLAVRLTDTNGDYVAAGAGTQYTEDVAAAADPVGSALNLIRKDTLAAITDADGDNVAARGTNKGELYVKHADSIAVTGTFWQATQPVSGTFWQATQPVSGPLTDTELRATAVPVSVASLPLPSGAATSAKQDTIITAVTDIPNIIGTDGAAGPSKVLSIGGTQATGEIQEIQVDADGQLQVDVLSSALPSGAATSAKQDTGNTSLATLAGAVAGTEMQVDVLTMPTVTETSASAIKTAVELIDDTVFTDDTSTHSTGTTKGVGIMAVATPTDASVNANDIGMPAMTTDRKLHVSVQDALPAGTAAIGKLLPPDIDVTAHTNYARKYYTNAGAVTDGIVWSPAAGKRWHIVALHFQVSAACTVTFEDDKAGGDDPVLKGEYAANSGEFLVFPEKYPMASGEDAADLLVTTSAGNIYITVVGYEI